MITITRTGRSSVKLTELEFNELAVALQKMLKWDVGGMYGDGQGITNHAGQKRAIRTLIKIGYEI